VPKITLADNHLVLSAAGNAERAALPLFSRASAIYPGDNKNLISHFIRETIDSGISLGLNARKVIEFCHPEDVNFNQTRWKYDSSPDLRETSFQEATNRFVHSRQLRIRTLAHPDRIFGNDIVMTEFIITTDRREPAHIDIFGFAWAYLSQIAPQMGLPD